MAFNVGGSGGMGGMGDVFGAQVVSKTLDYMNSQGGGTGIAFAPLDKQTFGAQVVSKTLDYMNSPGFGMRSGTADYDFQTSVLSAAYNPVGRIWDAWG